MPLTTTAQDLAAALKKRLVSFGYAPSDRQIHICIIDLMNVAIADSANIVAHSTTEVANFPVRPFTQGGA